MKFPTLISNLFLALLLGAYTGPGFLAHAESGHPDSHEDEHGHEAGGEEGHEEEAGVVKLSAAQMKTAGIVVEKIRLQTVAASLRAPGEVQLNAYRTVKITPRIAAQIVKRHARLGDEVKTGQPLVTLSSVEMAEAQGQLLVANREWQRVKKLGRKVVSDRRYTEARIDYEQARARVLAYGMSETEINRLLKSGNAEQANGTFLLVSPQEGRILHDKFIVGERVEPGQELMVIADESVMWVEARITPNEAAHVKVGNGAQVLLDKQILPARVSQIHHTLDEATRTLAIRLEVQNPDDTLHPGMFVSTRIDTTEQSRALAVPEEAVLRSPDGDWQVLVEQDEAGEFKAVEIELLRISDGKAVIDGIEAGTPVVVKGAFFVQSELAKSGFEVHNH